MERILVAGATGRLGRHVVRRLKQEGKWVRVLARDPQQINEPVDEVVQGDVRKPASLRGSCQGVSKVFSAAGASLSFGLRPRSARFFDTDYAGNVNLLQAARAEGVEKFVYVSVHSVPAIERLEYVRAHTDFADVLRRSGLTYGIVKPTGFFATFALLPQIARFGIAPLIGDGTARTNPIDERDLADLCVAALRDASTEVSVGGPEVLSRREIAERAFRAAGRKPRFVHLSDRLLDAQRKGLAWLDPRWAALLAFIQTASQVDVVAPTRGERRIEEYFRQALR